MPDTSVWRFNGTEAVRLIDEVRTWRVLELTFRAEASDLESVFREMDDASGEFDVIEHADGSYVVEPRGADPVTLEAPDGRSDLRSVTEYVIDGYEEKLQNQDEDIYEVTVEAVARSSKDSRDPANVTRLDVGGLGQGELGLMPLGGATGTVNGWHLQFADGDIETSRVERSIERGGKTFDGNYRLELTLRRSDAMVLEDSLNRQAAVRKQTVPDGEDKFRDENGDERNTVNITPPEGHSVVESGEYAVEEWEGRWANDIFFVYTLSLGSTK